MINLINIALHFIFYLLNILNNGSTISTVVAYAPKEPIAYTKYGPVRGATFLSRSKREYDAYRGIPYAASPIGKLRFKNPVEPTNWDFPFDARGEGPYCIQKNYLFANPKIEGQEDCLKINVYVPKTPNQPKLLPVMVFIHWGAFFAGRGTSGYLGPDYFMDTDVILVTFNYRLGVLGLFSTLDDEAPGNLALKDQRLALRWVQENIHAFGGDKNRVTLFGQSAGAGSVEHHMLSPYSKGLFSQAITQSGSSLALWGKPFNEIQVNVTAGIAAALGCGQFIGNSKEIVNCLQNVPSDRLVNISDVFKVFSVEPLTVFSPVIEKKTENNKEPFFTKQPLQYIFDGEFQKIPWIAGVVQDEGILRVSALTRQPDVLKQLNDNFETFFPLILVLTASTLNVGELSNNITTEYFGGKKLIDVNNPDSVQAFIDLYTDRAFAYPFYQSVMLRSAKGHKPIWVYNFNYRGQYSYGDYFATTEKDINFNWGVSHCDDLLYLFNSPLLFPDLSKENDKSMSDFLIKTWTNFAINGSPSGDIHINGRTLSINWPKVDGINSLNDMKNEKLYYLNITGSYESENIDFRVQNGFRTEKMHFWSSQQLFENFDGLQ